MGQLFIKKIRILIDAFYAIKPVTPQRPRRSLTQIPSFVTPVTMLSETAGENKLKKSIWKALMCKPLPPNDCVFYYPADSDPPLKVLCLSRALSRSSPGLSERFRASSYVIGGLESFGAPGPVTPKTARRSPFIVIG